MLAVDTNLLFFSLHKDSPFHLQSREFIESLNDRNDVVISELVLTELYRLLRNPVLNTTPRGAPEASEIIQSFRRHPRWRIAGFPTEGRRLHDRLWRLASEPSFPYRRLFDTRLALTLLGQGVRELATANVKDFEGLGFDRVWNPVVQG